MEDESNAVHVKKIGNGLINHSYQISCPQRPDFFLQRINTSVFENPDGLQENYMEVWQYAEFEFTGLRLPAPLYCGDMRTLFKDSRGHYWRAFEFIENGKTISIAEKPAQAKETAKAFASFTLALEEMNTDLLKEVIPGFHDLSLRFRQFEASLQTELYERMAIAIDLVKELKERERYCHFFEIITSSDEFPKRVMHHDAKISNVLFHEKTGKVICPVDYDTVMPGYYFSDLGDMIRSMASAAEENQTAEPEIRKTFYEAIVTGYTDVLGGILTASERKYIHAAGLLMIYMQSLRFLTDYLNGDIYYQVNHEGENLERARNQLALLKNMEQFLQQE
ncbi:MAG: aminoglycoside phosphotransferase family protein [Chitinophagaceae bacterium]|nr:aminoglycoside phosphotransferase family protein [Chitinophagaceae bacterium]